MCGIVRYEVDALAAFESSPGKRRHFRTRCGSHLMAERSRQAHVILRVATLDEDRGSRPVLAIWRSHEVPRLDYGPAVASHGETPPSRNKTRRIKTGQRARDRGMLRTMSNTLYEQDFHAWAERQAALLRARKFSDADIENIVEEIESMGRSERRELVSRLTVLLLHLLKWQFQPARRGSSWRRTIMVQRQRLSRHLRDNPSLASRLEQAMADAYSDARIEAEDETGLAMETFPDLCPFSFDEVIDPTFWPDG